jgi:hypothetical protein
MDSDESSIFTRGSPAPSFNTSIPTTTAKYQARVHANGNNALASKTRTVTLPTATDHLAELDLAPSFENKTFLLLIVDGQDVPISCLKCSTSGTLHASGTDFADSSDLIDFKGGLLEAQLPRVLGGHIELALTAPSSVSTS